jgi:hypothetical protein
MRELIARKEGQKNQDTEIMRLLKSLTIDENHMKVNRKINKDEEKKPSFWFTKTNSKKSDSKIPTTITTTTTTADVYLVVIYVWKKMAIFLILFLPVLKK